MIRVVKVKRFWMEKRAKRGVDWRSSETLLAELRPEIKRPNPLSLSPLITNAVSEHKKL